MSLNRSSLATNQNLVHILKGNTSPEPGNFEELLELARRHKVLWHVKQKLGNNLQPDQKLALDSICRQTLVRNMQFVGEMQAIQKIAQSHKIDILFYKGACLAAQLYGNLASRSFCDIDLITRTPEQARSLRGLLQALGYVWTDDLNESQDRSFQKLHCEYMLYHPQKKILVEIHWRFFYAYLEADFDNDQVFSRAVNVRVGQQEFPTLGLEDNVLMLAVHNFRHWWNDYRQIIDFATLIKTPGINWDFIRKEIESKQITRYLTIGIQLAILCGFVHKKHLPKHFQSSHRLVRKLALKVYNRHLSLGRPVLYKMHEELPYMLCLQDTWAKRLKFLLGAITAPSINDYKYVSFSESFSWLYYFVRPFRQIERIFRGK
jgi:hypothetical protein